MSMLRDHPPSLLSRLWRNTSVLLYTMKRAFNFPGVSCFIIEHLIYFFRIQRSRILPAFTWNGYYHGFSESGLDLLPLGRNSAKTYLSLGPNGYWTAHLI